MPTDQQINKTTSVFLSHKMRVIKYMNRIIASLIERSASHDETKMQADEFDIYSVLIDEFDKYQFGSPEYEELRERLALAIQHHYDHNRHHPEHFGDGINGMDLVDVLEMLCDWKAATQNSGGNGDLLKSITILSDKYGISPQLKQILINTAKNYGMF